MGKLLIFTLIILLASWLGRISASSKKDKDSKKMSRDESDVIDIELEDKP